MSSRSNFLTDEQRIALYVPHSPVQIGGVLLSVMKMRVYEAVLEFTLEQAGEEVPYSIKLPTDLDSLEQI